MTIKALLFSLVVLLSNQPQPSAAHHDSNTLGSLTDVVFGNSGTNSPQLASLVSDTAVMESNSSEGETEKDAEASFTQNLKYFVFPIYIIIALVIVWAVLRTRKKPKQSEKDT